MKGNYKKPPNLEMENAIRARMKREQDPDFIRRKNYEKQMFMKSKAALERNKNG